MESISSTDTQTQWDDISPSSYRFTIDTILWIIDFMMPQQIESSLLLFMFEYEVYWSLR